MIDITVDKTDLTINVENQVYFYAHPDQITAAIKEIVDKCKYSGESITLWQVVDNNFKKLIERW